MNFEEAAAIAIDSGLNIHREIGPGLFESVYEDVLASELRKKGLSVATQQPISFEYGGVFFEHAFRADIIVEQCLLIEVKSTERAAAVHVKQVVTYLRVLNFSTGLLMNFGLETFRDGLRRVVNNHWKPQ